METIQRQRRSDLIGGALAFLFSANALLVLLYGLLSTSGSSLFTGSFLVGSEFAVLLLTLRRFTLNGIDYLFCSFVLCIALSHAFNGNTTNSKEWVMLVVSLLAYPACRLISFQRIEAGVVIVSTAIFFVGTIATAYALVAQWSDPHGKPIVFGFPSAATQFLMAFGFPVIALATANLTWRKTGIVSALLFMPVVIFAASMVRFTFLALIGAIILAAILSQPIQRLRIMILGFVIVAGVAAGLFARSEKTTLLLSYVTEETKEISVAPPIAVAHGPIAPKSSAPSNSPAAPIIVADGPIKSSAPSTSPAAPIGVDRGPPSCRLDIDLDNSIAIRKALLRDALHLSLIAGPFGFGLDNFMSHSCVKETEIHNSLLQAIVEFGWLGGLSLFALVAVAGARLAPLGRIYRSARFAFCSLAYVTAISLIHGRTSRDILLFAVLGLAAGIVEFPPGRAAVLARNES
jgi:O-antigen ligase